MSLLLTYLKFLKMARAEGGKTGLTAMTVGIMFFVCVFFAPIFASIPAWATGGALVIVGSLMIRKCVPYTVFTCAVALTSFQ